MHSLSKLTLPALLIAMAVSGSAYASNQNVIRSAAAIPLSNNADQFWQMIDAYTSDWLDVGAVHDCTSWTPDANTQAVGSAFVQSQACAQDQERSVQQRQQNTQTQVIRNYGSAESESRTISESQTRQAVGTLETWVETSPVYSNWETSRTAYACSGWTPTSFSYDQSGSTGSFTQSSAACSVDQVRTRQDQEQETTTGSVRIKGTAVQEQQTLMGQSATRLSTITLGAWTASGDVTGCSNWSPDPSAYASGTAFTQTATDCSLAMTRSHVEQY